MATMQRSNAAIFLTGRLIALIVLMAFQVSVVRLLPPMEYGAYALIFAIATLMQTVISFGIPRLIPKYASQAGWTLHRATVRRMMVRIIVFRVIATAAVMALAAVVAVRLGFIAAVDPRLAAIGGAFVVVSTVQVDADAMAQALRLQTISRQCLVGEATVRLLLVMTAAVAGRGHVATDILAVSIVTSGLASIALLAAVLHALSQRDESDRAAALDRREFRAIALAGYASAMAWFASSPAVIRLIASRLLSVGAFAGFSFAQGLVLSFQRYTPGMLLFPFIEPNVMQHHARTGDRSRLEAALSLVVKIDMVTIGATVVGTIVAGRAIVELMTGGRYGALAYALPWLLVYIATSSIYRAFEIVAIALGASSVLVRTLVLSLAWLAVALLLTPRFGLIVLLVCPVGDSLSRLAIMAVALRRLDVRHVLDGRLAAATIGLVALCGGGGRAIAAGGDAGDLATIAIGVVAGTAYLIGIAAVRPLVRREADIMLGDRAPRWSGAIRRYARA